MLKGQWSEACRESCNHANSEASQHGSLRADSFKVALAQLHLLQALQDSDTASEDPLQQTQRLVLALQVSGTLLDQAFRVNQNVLRTTSNSNSAG